MDDLFAIQQFRSERDSEPSEARKAVWGALEARIEASAAEARSFGAAVAGQTTRTHSSWKHSLLSGRRRLAIFAAAAGVAALLTGVLVHNFGPTAEPASAAELLHRAAVAASAAPATSIPGPGQFLFRKERLLEIDGWYYPLPPEGSDAGALNNGGTVSGPHAHNALMPRTVETWTGHEGGGRLREIAGQPQFWSSEEEARWKAAGSPLPPPFSSEYQRRYTTAFKDANEVGPRVIDMDTRGWGNFNFPDTSKLPTEPEALRRAVEANEIEVTGFNLMYGKAMHLNTEQTMEELINVLLEGEPTPLLQAAIFDALAELPGMRVTEATDNLGRHGYAIRLHITHGFREEYLFSTNGQILASRDVLVDPQAAPSSYDGIPAGTAISEHDYVEEATVGSTNEEGGELDGEGPAATAASRSK